MTTYKSTLGNVLEVGQPVNELAKGGGAVALLRAKANPSLVRSISVSLNRQSTLELAAELIELADELSLAAPVRKAARELNLVDERFYKYASWPSRRARVPLLRWWSSRCRADRAEALVVKRNELGNPLGVDDDGEKAIIG